MRASTVDFRLLLGRLRQDSLAFLLDHNFYDPYVVYRVGQIMDAIVAPGEGATAEERVRHWFSFAEREEDVVTMRGQAPRFRAVVRSIEEGHKEAVVAGQLNRLRRLTPSFAYFFAQFPCSPAFPSVGNAWCGVKNYTDKHLFLLYEQPAGETLARYLARESCSPNTLALLVGQIAYALLLARRHLGFVHGELTAESIQVRVLRESLTITQEWDGVTTYFETMAVPTITNLVQARLNVDPAEENSDLFDLFFSMRANVAKDTPCSALIGEMLAVVEQGGDFETTARKLRSFIERNLSLFPRTGAQVIGCTVSPCLEDESLFLTYIFGGRRISASDAFAVYDIGTYAPDRVNELVANSSGEEIVRKGRGEWFALVERIIALYEVVERERTLPELIRLRDLYYRASVQAKSMFYVGRFFGLDVTDVMASWMRLSASYEALDVWREEILRSGQGTALFLGLFA